MSDLSAVCPQGYTPEGTLRCNHISSSLLTFKSDFPVLGVCGGRDREGGSAIAVVSALTPHRERGFASYWMEGSRVGL